MAKEKMKDKKEPVKNNKRIKATKQNQPKGKIVGKNTKAKENQLPKREVVKTPKQTTPKVPVEPKTPEVVSPIKVDPRGTKTTTSSIRRSYLLTITYTDDTGAICTIDSIYTSLVKAKQAWTDIQTTKKFDQVIKAVVIRYIADDSSRILNTLNNETVKANKRIILLEKPIDLNKKIDVEVVEPIQEQPTEEVEDRTRWLLTVDYKTDTYSGYAHLTKVVGVYKNKLCMLKDQLDLQILTMDLGINATIISHTIQNNDNLSKDHFEKYFKDVVIDQSDTQVAWRKIYKGFKAFICKIFNIDNN